MSEPINFSSTTPRFSIPLLFAGQAQKEFFFNEAQVLVDALLQLSVQGVEETPPANAAEGQCWIVGASPVSDWAGMEDAIALFASGQWKFIQPTDGMKAFDQALGQSVHFDGGWQTASTPLEPQGGSTIDSEARSAISAIIVAMRNQGILARAPS